MLNQCKTTKSNSVHLSNKTCMWLFHLRMFVHSCMLCMFPSLTRIQILNHIRSCTFRCQYRIQQCCSWCRLWWVRRRSVITTMIQYIREYQTRCACVISDERECLTIGTSGACTSGCIKSVSNIASGLAFSRHNVTSISIAVGSA